MSVRLRPRLAVGMRVAGAALLRTLPARVAVGVAVLLAPAAAVAQTPVALTPERQIAAALQAAPEDMRAAATVMGYDAAGKLVTLREGTNDLICLAHDPSREQFEVSCHHASIEPYVARGRALREQGVTGAAVNQTRWQEMEDGKLALPEKGASNYILTGAYDPASGEIREPFLRWVIYTPFATPENTGLSTTGGESAPWLMFPGTPGSHIMIVPPRAGSR
jgi:hypothetical protein